MRSRTAWLLVVVVAVTAMIVGIAQQPGRQVSLIVSGGTVVTVDAAHRVIPDGAVAIDGAEIVAVDTADAIRRQFRAAETIDAAGGVIMPGLVNTHTHAPM